jgi:protein arginine kinase activator
VKHKCDHCERPATTHSVEIVKGQKIEKHLCDLHASEAGLVIKAAHTPINELLTNFVKLHSGSSAQQESVCEHCGLSFSDFRENSLLGCPNCYKTFEEQLSPLLERAHEGATHHLGKVPRRAGAAEHRQAQIFRMRKRLDEAVAAEDYEAAARLRDDIRQFEEKTP